MQEWRRLAAWHLCCWVTALQQEIRDYYRDSGIHRSTSIRRRMLAVVRKSVVLLLGLLFLILYIGVPIAFIIALVLFWGPWLIYLSPLFVLVYGLASWFVIGRDLFKWLWKRLFPHNYWLSPISRKSMRPTTWWESPYSQGFDSLGDYYQQTLLWGSALELSGLLFMSLLHILVELSVEFEALRRDNPGCWHRVLVGNFVWRMKRVVWRPIISAWRDRQARRGNGGIHPR